MKLTPDQSALWLAIALSVFFAFCIGILVDRSIHWPLVSDPAQIHYVDFLIDHGRAPYRDLIEMNMPGTYLYTNAVSHFLGSGALAWRSFDLLLMGAMVLAMLFIARPYSLAGGVFGAGLFVLYHGRDGPGELGQRDLVIAVLTVIGYAFLFHALRKGKSWPMLLFGLCFGASSTIKPLPLPFFFLLLLMAAITLRHRRQPVPKPMMFAIAGLLIPAAIVLIFLLREHSLEAFIHTVHELLPYYASLRCGDWSYLLNKSSSPSLRLTVALVLGITLVRRDWHSWEQLALLAGICFGVASFLLQAKGFVYHRYPALAFLLLWGGIQFALSIRERGFARLLGVIGLATGIILAPMYVAQASRSHWNETYIASLTQDLDDLGGQALSGHVQCMDTVSECDTTLYRMQLLQATGLIYDFWVFGPDREKAVRISRQRFWRDLQQNPPTLFIVGTGLFPRESEGYAKLDYWSEFHDYLKSNYDLHEDRSFGKGNFPLAYRIYLRKPVATTSAATPFLRNSILTNYCKTVRASLTPLASGGWRWIPRTGHTPAITIYNRKIRQPVLIHLYPGEDVHREHSCSRGPGSQPQEHRF
jgi:hypothetical protein